MAIKRHYLDNAKPGTITEHCFLRGGALISGCLVGEGGSGKGNKTDSGIWGNTRNPHPNAKMKMRH